MFQDEDVLSSLDEIFIASVTVWLVLTDVVVFRLTIFYKLKDFGEFYGVLHNRHEVLSEISMRKTEVCRTRGDPGAKLVRKRTSRERHRLFRSRM